MEIYDVTVCKFCGREAGDIVEKLEVLEYTKHICVFDNSSRIAKDLETLEEFYVLRKNDQNRILASETDKIALNINLGVDIKPFTNMEELPLKRQLKIYRNLRKIEKEKSQKGKQKSIKR